VGIASHRLGEIPTLLRQDGAPPLYYLLLHVWMSFFGPSEVSTHGFSLLFGVAAVPAALWAGWSIFGRRTGWICAVLVAISPYLAFYSTETRMYSLVVLLALLVMATFVHAFVFGRRKYLPAFVVLLVLLMYAHNWGLLVAMGTALALGPCLALRPDRRRLVIDAALAFGAVGLLYLPWLPTLIYQRGQNLQPWADKPVLFEIRVDVSELVGGKEAVVALGFGMAAGLIVMLRRPWGRNALAVVVIAIVPFIVLVGGWRTGVVAYRYLAAVVAPLLLLLGAGLARGGRAAVAALWVAIFLTLPIGTKGPPYTKSNARAVAQETGPQLRADDLVISPDFEMVPMFAYYLPSGLRYATSSGPVPDEDIVDWRGSLARLVNVEPSRTVPPLVSSLGPGAHLLLVCPPGTAPTESSGGLRQGAPQQLDAKTDPQEDDQPDLTTVTQTVPPQPRGLFHAWIRLRCKQLSGMLLSDPALRLDRTLTPPGEVRNTSVEAYLFTKA